MRLRPASLLLAALGLATTSASVVSFDDRWRDPTVTPDVRAQAALQAMTQDEKLALVHARYGLQPVHGRKAADAIGSAGFAPGLPRLGLPPLQESDAGLGVANPSGIDRLNEVTALPSSLALGATFDPALAHAGGAMIGGEARRAGFNVLLAGGANLTRDPRGGRNFEYLGEDPLLTGRMVGEAIAGIQSQRVVSTIKHFALNDQETGRIVLSADLGERAARESDLLAFELALEIGHPGAVMTSYNRVNGVYASQNAALLSILKRDWHFDGWVMSDWGAVHDTVPAALAGLDQESGEEFDDEPYFGAPLAAAVERNDVPQARLDDMVRRQLRSVFAAGIVDDPPRRTRPGDLEADAGIARTIAENGIVLLRNERGALPLPRDLHRIVVIGAHADRGVLSGGGSSQVTPSGAFSLIKEQATGVTSGLKFYLPSPPLAAIRALSPQAEVQFVAGDDHAAAAAAARGADAVVVFAEQWTAESYDVPDMSLPTGQDDMIARVAAANPRTVVVLETGNPVAMPWRDKVAGIVEAWYPGARGGEAIADILFGRVNPSGRLPMTFPQDVGQLPRPAAHDLRSTQGSPGAPYKPRFDVDYGIEGADIGYKWHLRQRIVPLYPFGFGLSFTRFAETGLAVTSEGGRVVASFEVANIGPRAGTDTPQIYVESEDRHFVRRLAGFVRVTLAPGERQRIEMTIDPRLLATFDEATKRWVIAPGRYAVSARSDALADGPLATVTLAAQSLAP
ncbi:MAG: glycoside hydrolase family 3 C-terminal domain-containing protein [Beijerinckiaceae bacterium]|nr:glycoside hydrolase family 3 C-terminal domain-containing protein [Beijerinckiaceae bacterium]